ncbi:iron-dependent peroxidase [Paenibacillus sp. MMS18-CY102]|uniref:iron-dependent peroxidase n=1 Tax=Paenibacillus sp. MMS18-CY102 TaxID=2682849 RepID=UPI001923FF2E|nr:iron-dependent peroxidase [Paenibacillus sp. MMS18-CY102]
MNYIWDLMIRAANAGMDKRDITFVPARSYSPYMELSLQNLNASAAETVVEVNPYYRFEHIFSAWLDPNVEEYDELRYQLFDLIMHQLADIDIVQGMSRQEYYIQFILRDMEEGAYGVRVSERIGMFNQLERDGIAANLLGLYQTGEALYWLKNTMRKVFKRSTIYAICEEKDELILYVGQEETVESRAKVELILDLFLPVRFRTELYWSRHFGILGVEDTMRLDTMALY